jgi:hypothetical protein
MTKQQELLHVQIGPKVKTAMDDDDDSHHPYII